MFCRIPAILCLAPLLLSLPSCASYGADFREIAIKGHSGADLWRSIEEFAISRGFRTDPNETDIGRQVYQTRWDGSGGAFGRARRRRFHAEILEARADDTADWIVRYFVEVQTVNNSERGNSPKEEDWEESGQDGVMEQVFRQVMYLSFRSKSGPVEDGALGAEKNRQSPMP